MNTSRSARIVGTFVGVTAYFAWELCKLAFVAGCAAIIIIGAAAWLS